jgi:hypothetical protein
MWKLALFLLTAAFVSAAGVEARAQVVNATGGYVCQGNCALPGRCARAYVDGWWPANTHVSFYNEAGVWSDGMYVGPRSVVATTWGMRGFVTPTQIVWFRPPLRRPYARWIRTAACPF